MSLKMLIDLANKMKQYEDGGLPAEEVARIEEANRVAYIKMAVLDKEIEERIRLRQPTAEQLRKTCTI